VIVVYHDDVTLQWSDLKREREREREEAEEEGYAPHGRVCEFLPKI
jgi:hypothetical protein